MSDPTQAPPVDTGNPGLNSLIRSGLLLASGAATAWIVSWLSAKGFYDPNWAPLIALAVFTTLGGIAAAAWGYIRGTQFGKMLAGAQLTGVAAGVAAQASMTATPPIAAPGTLTHADAAVIVQKFAPPIVLGTPSPPGTTADDLNTLRKATP